MPKQFTIDSGGAGIITDGAKLTTVPVSDIQAEKGANYLLLADENQEHIKVSDDPNSPHFGNTILGATSVATAWANILASGIGLKGTSGASGSTGATVMLGGFAPTLPLVIATGKKLYRVYVKNFGTSSLYLQFFTVAAPATGATPVAGLIFELAPGDLVLLDNTFFGNGGELVASSVSLSSTIGTYTAAAATNVALNLKVES
jgi:hypothetical protein